MKRLDLLVGAIGLVLAAGVYGYGESRSRSGPTLAAAQSLGQQIADRAQDAAATAHRRAVEISVLERPRAVVSTDAATARDLTSEEISIVPATNEVIEIGQLLHGGRAVSLLRLPKGALPVAALDHFGAHLALASGQLIVSDAVEIQPLDRADELTGVVAVSLPVELKSLATAVEALGWRARLDLPEGSVPVGTTAPSGDGRSVEVALQGTLMGRTRLTVQSASPDAGALFHGLALALVAASLLAGAAIQWRGKRAAAAPTPDSAQSARRYRLVRNIASGGMGEVWEAVALGSGGFERKVAIKRVLPGRTSDQRYLRMFVDEARIASKLHHANIAAVLDFGVADGAPFQVLEYVDGTDLRALWLLGRDEGQRMSLELALHVCVQVAHALQYAHEAKDDGGQPLHIVHRDVTPANILVSWEGDIKLSDFGIALADGRLEKTAEGIAKGKLGYMAPEQATGGTIDARTDVFALGCVLHALVAGVTPFSGEDGFQRMLAGEEADLQPAVPDTVRPIVAKAIRRSRLDRYGSARAMAEAMGAVLASRLMRDPRLAMREWLVQIRHALESAPSEHDTEPGGSELVLSNEADAVPVFTTHPGADARRT